MLRFVEPANLRGDSLEVIGVNYQPKIRLLLQCVILIHFLIQPKEHAVKVWTVFFPITYVIPKSFFFLGWPLAESVSIKLFQAWSTDQWAQIGHPKFLVHLEVETKPTYTSLQGMENCWKIHHLKMYLLKMDENGDFPASHVSFLPVW